MKLLENSYFQPDSKVVVETDSAKVELVKLSDDLSMATITVTGGQSYTFTARSGVLTTHVGSGVITNNTESYELNLFQRVALSRNEKITITNNQAIPLVMQFVSAN